MEQSELDELVATADKRAVYLNQVEHAKAKFRTLNVLHWEGHTFELTQGFLAHLYVKYTAYMGFQDSPYAEQTGAEFDPIILLDKNEEPILIENDDLHRFVEEVEACHTEALHYYHETYSALKYAQTPSDLIEVG